MDKALINELKSFLVERYVDNMSTKDLVNYVTDDLDDLYKNMSDEEFIDEAKNYWDDGFGEVIDEIQDYMKTPFKQPLRESFEETN
tara:strand:- start:12690 stop:12947 length:258 start_codon:yes stop_codon:yes gene_type:complete